MRAEEAPAAFARDLVEAIAAGRAIELADAELARRGKIERAAEPSARAPGTLTPVYPCRPHSSLIAAIPAFGVKAGSGAPIRACRRFLLPPPAAYPAHQIGASPAGIIFASQQSSSQVRAARIGIREGVSPTYSQNRV